MVIYPVPAAVTQAKSNLSSTRPRKRMRRSSTAMCRRLSRLSAQSEQEALVDVKA